MRLENEWERSEGPGGRYVPGTGRKYDTGKKAPRGQCPVCGAFSVSSAFDKKD
jgi:hypothetical protein